MPPRAVDGLPARMLDAGGVLVCLFYALVCLVVSACSS